jgi:nitrite reductase/ring-hydroxylating ferredoxin subunit
MAEAVLAEDELWVGEMRGLVLRGERLLVVRLEQQLCVYRDRCPHQGHPLSEGKLEQGVITCRFHEHRFDAATGAGINPRGSCLTPLPSRVEAGKLLVELEPARKAMP